MRDTSLDGRLQLRRYYSMGWRKVIEVVGRTECPKCGGGFIYRPHPTGDEIQRDDILECGVCGYTGPLADWIKPVGDPDKPRNSN
jgi:ribosomal protein S27AE